jgi:hypothetical protein
VNVATVLETVIVGDAEANGMQVAKSSVETCTEPEQAPLPSAVSAVSVAGFIAALNVTLMVDAATELPVLASAGVVAVTVVAAQKPSAQLFERQSALMLQARPFAQPAQVPPPQSMAVSLPFLTVSVQLAAWQTLLVQTPLGQSAPTRQSTHTPLPSQKSPVPQAVPAGVLPWLGTPLVQTSVVQALPSFGRSVSSTCVVVPPLPLQTAVWQSPAVCVPSTVPEAALFVWHALPVHANDWHSVVVPHCAAVLQSTHAPAPSQKSPVPQAVSMGRFG